MSSFSSVYITYVSEVAYLKSLNRREFFALERQDPAGLLTECHIPEELILTFMLELVRRGG